MTAVAISLALLATGAAMLALLWRLTVDEALWGRIAKLTGHRPLGDAGLDDYDASSRVTDVQAMLLLVGLMLVGMAPLPLLSLLV